MPLPPRPAKHRQVLCLPHHHVMWLRKQSTTLGISYSEVIRRLIDKEMGR
jgi:hypothetical protein